MQRLTPIHWKVFEKILIEEGFEFIRQKGSHRIYIKKGAARPIVLPAHNKPLSKTVIQCNLETANISRERYFELLEKFK